MKIMSTDDRLLLREKACKKQITASVGISGQVSGHTSGHANGQSALIGAFHG
jgi:hypothetical protein